MFCESQKHQSRNSRFDNSMTKVRVVEKAFVTATLRVTATNRSKMLVLWHKTRKSRCHATLGAWL
jgi:hypothetical protein